MIGPITTIIHTVAQHYGIAPARLTGSRGNRRVSEARHVASAIARLITGKPYSEIGRRFNRDHSTVISGVDKVMARIVRDQAFMFDFANVYRKCDDATRGLMPPKKREEPRPGPVPVKHVAPNLKPVPVRTDICPEKRWALKAAGANENYLAFVRYYHPQVAA